MLLEDSSISMSSLCTSHTPRHQVLKHTNRCHVDYQGFGFRTFIDGYMDPDYYRLEVLTSKSDVYSFGVMLLELFSGRKAIHKNENGVPRNVVPYIIHDEIHRILDPRMPAPTPFEIEAVAYVGYLAADCVKPEGRDRPTMTEVVNSLERALEACLAPPLLSRSTTGSSMATSQSR